MDDFNRIDNSSPEHHDQEQSLAGEALAEHDSTLDAVRAKLGLSEQEAEPIVGSYFLDKVAHDLDTSTEAEQSIVDADAALISGVNQLPADHPVPTPSNPILLLDDREPLLTTHAVEELALDPATRDIAEVAAAVIGETPPPEHHDLWPATTSSEAAANSPELTPTAPEAIPIQPNPWAEPSTPAYKAFLDLANKADALPSQAPATQETPRSQSAGGSADEDPFAEFFGPLVADETTIFEPAPEVTRSTKAPAPEVTFEPLLGPDPGSAEDDPFAEFFGPLVPHDDPTTKPETDPATKVDYDPMLGPDFMGKKEDPFADMFGPLVAEPTEPMEPTAATPLDIVSVPVQGRSASPGQVQAPPKVERPGFFDPFKVVDRANPNFPLMPREAVAEVDAETLPSTEGARNIAGVLERLEHQSIIEGEPHPKESIVGDGLDLEGQQTSFIKTESGTRVVFKLTAGAYDRLTAQAASRSRVDERTIGFQDFNYGNMIGSTADVFEVAGLDVAVARKDPDWNALRGVVEIEVPAGLDESPELTGRRIDSVMRDLLGIEGAFEQPSSEDEHAYKSNRNVWHHKLRPGEEDPAVTGALVQREVFPGYNTFIEPGRAAEYEAKYGEYAFTHSLYDATALVGVLRNGLLSSRERLGRGLRRHGMSTEMDFRTGGADSVFTRLVNEQTARTYGLHGSTVQIVLKPDLAERTDWYTYNGDKYGETSEIVMSHNRLSPHALFTEPRLSSVNEQMFRTGIPVEMMAGAVVSHEAIRLSTLKTLQEAGISEVNGVPIEDFVTVASRGNDVLDVAHGRKPKPPDPSASTADPFAGIFGPLI